MASLQPVKEKLKRAVDHLEAARAVLSGYMETNPYSFVLNEQRTVDSEGRVWGTGGFVSREPIPTDLALIIGDCLTNLRSSLDYLVHELVEANGKNPSEGNAFPISVSAEAYAKRIDNGCLRGVSPDARTLIKTMQPYNGGYEPEHSLLWVLNALTNINKHRRLLLTLLRVRPAPDPGVIQTFGSQSYAPVNPPGPHDDAEIGPFLIEGDVMHVNTNFMAYIVFDEAPAKGFEFTSMLDRIGSFLVIDIVSRFDQFF
jgi:hypothetical protein